METIDFQSMNLSEPIKKAINDMGFEEATPIQTKAIPHILEGSDIIGQAQTGTGKTCAFGIPAIEMIDEESETLQILVLCPTRELAIQTSEEIKNLTKYKNNIRILPVYGGQSIERQISVLKKRPQIVIGTPGRIMDHMRRHTIKLSGVKLVVLDEADEMLNMGFREDMDIILEKTPEERQTVLFSATMPKEILELTGKYQKNPIHIKVIHKELTVPGIEQFYLEVRESDKLEILTRVIDGNNIKLSLIFCNTKKRVDELSAALQSRGYSVEALHGDMRQEQRNKVMAQFRKGNIDILVATDVAARGIDIDNIEAVFNYDIPNDEEYYVHRIGRTGRAGRSGKSYTLITGREIFKLKEIQHFTKSTIIRIKPPTLADIEENRVNIILDEMKTIMDDGHLNRFAGYIEKALESATGKEEEGLFPTTLDAAAALLKMIASKTSQTAQNDDNLDYLYAADGLSDGEGDTVRMFINVGRADKIQPRHIIECIASSSKLPGRLIGSIDIYDKFTFVDIPREYAHEVLESMKNAKLKGKRINMEKSKAKASTTDSKASRASKQKAKL